MHLQAQASLATAAALPLYDEAGREPSLQVDFDDDEDEESPRGQPEQALAARSPALKVCLLRQPCDAFAVLLPVLCKGLRWLVLGSRFECLLIWSPGPLATAL